MENIQAATHSLANPISRIKPRRAGVPCVRCRQMKVKCNASQKFPASCSACEKAGERCSVDPLFKRVSKRSLKPHHEHEEGENAYRTPHSEGSGTEPPALPSGLDAPLPGLEPSVASIAAELRLSGKRPARFTHEATGVYFTSSVVAELLEEYFSHVHPRFPLLLEPATTLDCYEKAPLLFWSVLAIASKDSDKYASDYPRLQILVRQLVADILLLGTRSIYLVQALLLLCVWSFPHEDMNKEPFSMYCSVAISMARSLGLHRPQHPFLLFAAKSSEIGTTETRTATWLACFIVDQWHTARFGVPSSIRIDHTVLHAVNAPIPGVSATTRIQLHIALVASKISAALGECETSANGLTADPLPFVRVFETELSTIHEKYAFEWSAAEQVSFLDARLSLYSYVLDQGKRRAEGPKNLLHHRENELITQSSLTARQLLTILTTSPDALRKGTFHVFRSASYAVFFLLRILGGMAAAPRECIDEPAIRNIIRQTFTLMREMSQTANDRRSQCVRVCRIIEHMIDYEDWDRDTPFLGRAESFMANNFVADVAARGIIKANTARHAAAASATANAIPAATTERDCRDGAAQAVVGGGAGPPEAVEPTLDLDFSIWDPMAWHVNWQESDELLFLGENMGGSS
ncbi:fungal-specific transcription factor domain-containing protein [Aspergillus pseudoustus]|uniref:Fungal-specific transcription factor domain-containing protein n=1 Tax=Aspergillus pseudoustus TaxID=1810923 RepID=A0ABR4KBD9_9EURO